ncbi:response regulator [Sphingomonas histidinilytica]|uniref:Response regulator receiver domain-containing protein n=1 Tax=Rhizorhabdus histidinilytica TaxID=439228 RepID=A0A1T5FKN9_9SPHN|nr:response regulator [Rhizorhabdus histidinilytica]MBO9380102.1 response regulator [Rhizorhabdus histidinilytica]QEH79852.1 response regulator [Sphingomonas sp. C8-2]SKB96740.1 Response regulator receiver domain-containing protein [Rhizorhabdus histidinilytica]
MGPTMPNATVLLVEDELFISMLTQDVLESAGLTVIVAYDGLEALELLRAHPEIDLLFTDVNLPSLDGRVLAQRAMVERPELQLILTSGRHRLSAEEIPDDGKFLPKPYSPRELMDLVQSELDQRPA